MTLYRSLMTGAAAIAMVLPAAAIADDLTLAVGSEATSIDPHYHNLTPNNALADHFFDPLVGQDERQRLVPALATEWTPVAETTWEFTLREGVTFHDGSPFTADDVVFTLERAPDVPNSPSSFALYTKSITEVEVVDDHTVRFHTAEPYPLLPTDLSNIFIISRENGEGAATTDYNSGEAAIGTGPYEFVSYTPGESVVMTRNEDYWGEVEPWTNVTIRPITNDAARVAALLAGDVDMIENVPTADIASLADNPDVSLSQGVSNRVIYFHLDSSREVTPHVTAKDGSEITNPFLDLRVRRALSHAIDRDAIVEEVMEGVAIPAGQLLPEGFFGVSPNIDVPAYDPDMAMELLAEAGYGDGFKVTLHGPNDRYINDAQIVQAVAQMLERIGLETEVDTMPRSVFFSRATGGPEHGGSEFSLMLVGWGSGTGEASSPLRSLLHTRDVENGFGPSNRGRFSNAEVDSLIQEALRTVDEAAREKLLQEATELAMDQVGIIPTHFQVNTWGTRTGLTYTPRTDENTLAMGVRAAE